MRLGIVIASLLFLFPSTVALAQSNCNVCQQIHQHICGQNYIDCIAACLSAIGINRNDCRRRSEATISACGKRRDLKCGRCEVSGTQWTVLPPR
jgi:hypothetical protein